MSYQWFLNGSPIPDDSVSFSSSMYVPPSPGPVYYQWRKNGIPIAGRSGLCTTTDDETYTAATYTIAAVTCADSASYSAVFMNDYWKVASTDALITVQNAPQVTVTVSGVPITDIHSPPVLTADPSCSSFTPVCWQWYQVDSSGGVNFKKPIPGATGNQYTFPNPVTCESLGPTGSPGYFRVEAFDGDRVPHLSNVVQVYGVCQ